VRSRISATGGRRGGGQLAQPGDGLPAEAVDDERPQADRADAVLAGVHAGGALVGRLVDAIEGVGQQFGVIGDQAGPVPGRVAEDRGRAGEGQPDVLRRGADRLEDVDRADHVDHRAERRVGGAERQLQAGQVDHVSDAAVRHHGRDGRAAGHIELAELELVFLAFCAVPGGEPEAAQVRAQVGGQHGHALVKQQPHDPRADAAARAGDQELLG
jgi:hypothetical protein